MFGLPGVLRRPLFARIESVNRVYDEVFATYGGLRVDLAANPAVFARGRSGRSTACTPPSSGTGRSRGRTPTELLGAGFSFEPPALAPSGGQEGGWRRDVSWMVREGAPWMGRRARDLGPWAVRMAWEETRQRAVVARG